MYLRVVDEQNVKSEYRHFAETGFSDIVGKSFHFAAGAKVVGRKCLAL
jgi:hypothetical protein